MLDNFKNLFPFIARISVIDIQFKRCDHIFYQKQSLRLGQ